MKRDSLETALQWIEAVNEKNLDRLLALSDSGIEIIGPRGSFRGIAILAEWMDRANLSVETLRGYALNDAVVLDQKAEWHLAETGYATVASRFVIQNGKVIGYQRHDALFEALDAAGLDELNEVTLP